MHVLLNVVQLLQLVMDAERVCVSNREVRGCGAIDAPVQVWVGLFSWL